MTDHVKLVGLLAGALTSIGPVFQILQILSTRHSGDVSWPFFTLLLSGTLGWLYYGLMRRDVALILWDGVGVACCTTVLVLKVFYG